MNLKMLRNQRKTEEGDPQDDDTYLGYSVTTGEFNGDGDRMDIAVGMPRGANLTGKVRITLPTYIEPSSDLAIQPVNSMDKFWYLILLNFHFLRSLSKMNNE